MDTRDLKDKLHDWVCGSEQLTCRYCRFFMGLGIGWCLWYSTKTLSTTISCGNYEDNRLYKENHEYK